MMDIKAANLYRMVIEWSEEDEVFVVRVPALDGYVTQPMAHGETQAKAAAAGATALQLALEALGAEGRRIPPFDARGDYSGKLNVRLPKELHHELDVEAEAEGVSLNTLLISRLAKGAPGTRPHGAIRKRRVKP